MVTNMFPIEKNPTSGIQVKLQAESLKREGVGDPVARGHGPQFGQALKFNHRP